MNIQKDVMRLLSYPPPPLPATNAKRLRKGALATKQSMPSAQKLDCFAEPVIERRYAPTRWLAMTCKLFSPRRANCKNLPAVPMARLRKLPIYS
jgi:hypothetical protein